MGRKVKAAAVHSAPVFMDKAATIKKTVGIIENAGEQGLELLVFPETFIPGYPYFVECYPPIKQVNALAQYAEQSVTVNSSELDPIRAACRTHSVSIVLGVSERVKDGYTLFNSQVFISSTGAIKGVHRKLQPTYVERMVWAQGGGHTLRTYDSLGDYKIGGLCCWENTMNLSRQALIMDGQEIHAGAWPALSTMAGFESAANSQIEALMKNHALTGQTFVICASNYIDESCIEWMKSNLGEQDSVKAGGGWSAIIHPFCIFLAGPNEGPGEKLVSAEIDLDQMGVVKVWIDGTGHYRRPEVLDFSINRKPLWADDISSADWPPGEDDQAAKRKMKVDNVSRPQETKPGEGESKVDRKTA